MRCSSAQCPPPRHTASFVFSRPPPFVLLKNPVANGASPQGATPPVIARSAAKRQSPFSAARDGDFIVAALLATTGEREWSGHTSSRWPISGAPSGIPSDPTHPGETTRGNHTDRLCARLSRHVLAAGACREGDRVVRIEGDPDQPFTAGFACAKVNRDAELVHSPERLATPLRRIGAKGEGKFAPITWDEALDEITSRWKAIIAESGPLALLGYCYSAHQGQMNRGLPNGLFHAMGTSRLWAGTVCDSCMRGGVGRDGRADRRRRSGVRGRVRSGDLLGRRPVRHQRAFLGEGRGSPQARRASSW